MPPGQFDSTMVNRALEHAIMVRAGSRSDMIPGRFRRADLQKLLQFTLGILDCGYRRHLAEGIVELSQNKVARPLKAAVEEDSSQQRFESVRQRGKALSSAGLLLTPAQDQVPPQSEPARLVGKAAAVHQLRPSLGQRTLPKHWEFVVKRPGQHELKDGVTEKLKALVGLDGIALFVGNRRVGQREAEEIPVLKTILQAIFELVVFTHGKALVTQARRGLPLRALLEEPLRLGLWRGPGRRAD